MPKQTTVQAAQQNVRKRIMMQQTEKTQTTVLPAMLDCKTLASQIICDLLVINGLWVLFLVMLFLVISEL